MGYKKPVSFTSVGKALRYTICGGLVFIIAFLATIQETPSKPWSKDALIRTPNGSSNITDHQPSSQEIKMKKILLWNPFFGEPDYGVGGFGDAAFKNSNCSKVCWTTNNRSELAEADAVMIHTFNMGPSGQNAKIPPRMSKDQIFVFFILESPLRSFDNFLRGPNLGNIFNLTFTFVDDPETDIYIPMGGVQKREVPDDSKVLSIKTIKEKKHAVAWFVSNCNAPSAREDYARELNKSIPVHIYGSCGSDTCPMGNFSCFYQIMKEHMFYLAFENSFCTGYTTEKLFRTLQTEMVPITLGRTNLRTFLPLNSHIDIRDYDSPRDLAKHLLMLQKKPTKYREYFEWKRHYEVLLEGDMKAQGFCQLCEILHSKKYPYKTNYNPLKYWNPKRWCLRDEDEKEAIHLI